MFLHFHKLNKFNVILLFLKKLKILQMRVFKCGISKI